MHNLIYQALAVGLRSILIFSFIYFVTKSSNTVDFSLILAEFTYASIFANIICFGFDVSILQQKNLTLERKSFLARILFGILLTLCLIYIQELSLGILFISIAFTSALILKGFVRASKKHKLDFSINLLSFLLFLIFVFFKPDGYSLLMGLALSLILPNLVGLFRFLKFKNTETYQNIIISIFSNFPLMAYSLAAYLLLNVDVYIFEYLDKMQSYNNFVVSNKFFINLTIVPVIFSNYRIGSVFGTANHLHTKFLREFVFVGVGLAVFSYIFAPYVIQIISSNTINLNEFELGLFSLIVLIRSINSYYNMRILKLVSNWSRLHILLTTLIIHIFLLNVLINKFDWQGALYALFISSLLLTVSNCIILRKYNGN